MIKRLLFLSWAIASGIVCFSIFTNAKSPNTSASSVAFDTIVKDYQTSKELPIRKALDDFNVFLYLGDIEDKSVLDLACGSGYYARQFVARGAEKVVGVDISPKMIELAKQQQEGNSISYSVSDVVDLNEDIGQFDAVTGIFLLHFAENQENLERMFEVAFRSLKPGGIFLALNNNIRQGEQNTRKGYYHKYNFETVYREPIREGSICDVKLFNEDGTVVPITAYHHSFETYENAAKKAGFEVLEALPLLVLPEAITIKGTEYWQDFLDKPSALILRAYKPF